MRRDQYSTRLTPRICSVPRVDLDVERQRHAEIETAVQVAELSGKTSLHERDGQLFDRRVHLHARAARRSGSGVSTRSSGSLRRTARCPTVSAPRRERAATLAAARRRGRERIVGHALIEYVTSRPFPLGSAISGVTFDRRVVVRRRLRRVARIGVEDAISHGSTFTASMRRSTTVVGFGKSVHAAAPIAATIKTATPKRAHQKRPLKPRIGRIGTPRNGARLPRPVVVEHALRVLGVQRVDACRGRPPAPSGRR